MIITLIEVNGKRFYRERDFDEAKVYPPSLIREQLYWTIILYRNNREIKAIDATGQVTVEMDLEK